MTKLTITKPDDWHLHLRQDDALDTTVPHVENQFGRAIIMPNTVPPITDIDSALNYKKSIIKKTSNPSFNPLMTLYLTDNTTVDTIKLAASHQDIIACKLYPQGATTNSNNGVSNIKNIYSILEAMQECKLPLLIHGEVTDDNIDIFDRENVFIEQVLLDVREKFPELKITLEHISTKAAVDFISDNTNNTAATITPHHLLLNRNDLLVGGIKPHYYCLPILKNMDNQQAIIKAALSGKPYFFAGSDSAPHAVNTKESACGCAGIYHGPNTVLAYAEFFEKYNAIDKLEPFISQYGADFYNFPRTSEKITLVKKRFTIPKKYNYLNKDNSLVPFYSDKTLNWSYE